MPATQGYRLDEWHESPFLSGTHSVEFVPDARVFDTNNPEDIAVCLMENDPEIEAYRWSNIPEGQLEELALESAKRIIRERQERYMDNVLKMRFQNATRKRRLTEGAEKLAVVVMIAENLETGETEVLDQWVPTGRNIG